MPYAPGANIRDPGRTRTCNLWFRWPTPYPLGHKAKLTIKPQASYIISCRNGWADTKVWRCFVWFWCYPASVSCCAVSVFSCVSGVSPHWVHSLRCHSIAYCRALRHKSILKSTDSRAHAPLEAHASRLLATRMLQRYSTSASTDFQSAHLQSAVV